MSLKEDIAAQKLRNKQLKSIGIGAIKTMPKARITTQQRIEQAKKEQLNDILQALRDNQPKQPDSLNWQRGYNAARSIIERAASESGVSRHE